MKIQFLLSAVLLNLVMGVPSFVPAFADQDTRPPVEEVIPIGEEEAAFGAIYQEALAPGSVVRDWLHDMLTRPVRHDLDRVTNDNLRGSETAKKLAAELRRALPEMIQSVWVSNMTVLLRATEEPPFKAYELALMKRVANRALLPPDAVEDSSFFVSGANTVNAYTYSTVDVGLQMVFFQGILDAFRNDPHMIAAVQAHEAGHVVFNHIFNTMLLQLVFDMTGEILIPDRRRGRPNQIEKDEFHQMIEDRAVVAYAAAFGHDTLATLQDSPMEHALRGLAQGIRNLGLSIAAQIDQPGGFSRADLRQLANDLTSWARQSDVEEARVAALQARLDTMLDGGTTPAPATAGADEEEEMEAEDEEEKPWKVFEELLGMVRYANETSCDRLAMLTVGHDGLIESMAKLAGGPDAPAAAVLAQTDEIAEFALAHRVDLARLENGRSHPSTNWRVAQQKHWIQTDDYKIVSDPFLRALEIYMIVTGKLKRADDAFQGGLKGEIPDSAMATVEKTRFQELAGKLADELAARVLAEFDAFETQAAEVAAGRGDATALQEGSFTRFLGLMKYLREQMWERFDGEKEVWWRELRKDGRLFDRIIKGLKAKTGNEHAQRAAVLLEQEVGRWDPHSDLNNFAKVACEKALDGGDGGEGGDVIDLE